MGKEYRIRDTPGKNNFRELISSATTLKQKVGDKIQKQAEKKRCDTAIKNP